MGGVDLDVCRPYVAGETLPDGPAGYDGVVVMGGAMGANDDATSPWLTPTKELIRRADADRVPTLGICLGHQLAAVALGGEVRPNPRGRQFGLLDVGWEPGGPSRRALRPGGHPSPRPAVERRRRHSAPRRRAGPGPGKPRARCRPHGSPRRSGACSGIPRSTSRWCEPGRRTVTSLPSTPSASWPSWPTPPSSSSGRGARSPYGSPSWWPRTGRARRATGRRAGAGPGPRPVRRSGRARGGRHRRPEVCVRRSCVHVVPARAAAGRSRP